MPRAANRFEGVGEQHRKLSELIRTLQVFLEEPRPEIGQEGYQTWASALAENLTGLLDKVSRHFRAEERSGFLEEVERQFPQALQAVESLRRDHDRVLADLRAILSAALCYAEGGAPQNPQLRRWTLGVLNQLLEHEAEETEMLQRLYYEDVGRVD